MESPAGQVDGAAQPGPGAPAAVPARLTSFVGREAERAELAALIGEQRLVTVAGPGGCGKTSLAAVVAGDVAARFADGVRWADLAPVADPARVPYAVLAAVGLGDARGMDPVDRLSGYLAGRQMLLVVDNCEHVASSVGKLLDELLGACQNLCAVSTSREPLSVEGERVWRVPPLSLPRAGEARPEAVLATESGRLFADRAADALRGFRVDETNAADIAALCARLDGLPLALELAAARVRALRPDRILAGLDQRFRLLTGGQADAMPHQQTLAASVEWSHALLTDLERVLLRRLSVFAGSFDLGAAAAVTAGDLLERGDVVFLLADLVERSLVVFDGDRYRMLQTIREFAAAALSAAGEERVLRAAHLSHYSAVSARAGEDLARSLRVATLATVDADYDNLVAATEHALATGACEAALRIAGDLGVYWLARGRYTEALTWTRRVLAQASEEPTPGRLRALWVIGQIGMFCMDLPGAFGTAETARAVELARHADDAAVLGRALAVQNFFAVFGAPAAAAPGFAATIDLADAADDPFGTLSAHAYAALAWTFGCDRPADAAPHLARLDAAARSGGSAYWAAWHGLGTGLAAWRGGRLGEAGDALRAAWASAEEVGDPMLESWTAAWLCDALLALGAEAEVEQVLAATLPRQDRSTIARAEWLTLRLADLAQRRGDPGAARSVLDGVEPVVRMLGIPFVTGSFDVIAARTALATGDVAAAETSSAEATGLAGAVGTPWWIVEAGIVAGRVARAKAAGSRGRDGTEAAEDAFQAALATCAAHGFSGVAAEALEGIASVAVAGGSWAEAARLYGAAEGLRTTTGHRRPPVDEPARSADLERLCAELGAEPVEALLAEGAGLPLADAAAYASRARGERRRPPSGWASLTPTELAVVDLVAEGLSNAAIAARLFVTTATAKSHLHHVFVKVGVANRTQLAAEALARRHADTSPARPG